MKTFHKCFLGNILKSILDECFLKISFRSKQLSRGVRGGHGTTERASREGQQALTSAGPVPSDWGGQTGHAKHSRRHSAVVLLGLKTECAVH